MSLKKRAIEGIVVAGSLVMMSTIAQAADLDGVQVRNAAVQAETDFATGGTAGVVARLDQLEAEAFGNIEAATAGVNQTGRLLVATAEEAVSDTEAAETLYAQPPSDIFCHLKFISTPVVGSTLSLIIISTTVEPITSTFFILSS